MSLETKHFCGLKNFRLDLVGRVLLRDGKPLSLTRKAFHPLTILVENHGRIVEKGKMMTEIWADSFAAARSKMQLFHPTGSNSPSFAAGGFTTPF